MGFKSRAENGGLLDPNRNNNGRPKVEGKLTRRELKEKEQMSILRKLRPNISQAIVVASKIMNNDKAPEASRLKACTIILDNYKELVETVYSGNDEDDGEMIQDNTPKTAFSLVMINPADKTEVKE